MQIWTSSLKEYRGLTANGLFGGDENVKLDCVDSCTLL